MPVIQKHVYTPAEGKEVVTIGEWAQIASFTPEDRFEFDGAVKKRGSLRKLSEALGHLVTTNNETLTQEVWVWVNQEFANEGIPVDPVFEKYHNRFLEETNQTYQLVTEIQE